MTAAIGQPISRVDGPAKVSGGARYAGEFEMPGLAHAALVLSTLPAGRMTAIETAEAERAPGVLAVISHQNAPRLPYRERKQRPQVDPQAGDQLKVFQEPEIHFSGQPVAVVVAETLEMARHAAALVRVRAEATEARTRFDPDAAGSTGEGNAKAGRPDATQRGDADAALSAAAATVDGCYSHPREYHNAIEPHVTIAAWEGGRLTLYDKTQWVMNVRETIAHIFGMEATDIRVVSPFVGGAFGSGLRTWPHVTIAALAARQAGRPVRLELSRRELFSAIGFRPRTEQRVRLGADRDGRLRAVVQEAWAETSSYERYAETTLEPAQTAYQCPNVRTGYKLVQMNTNSPCPMRAPGIVTGLAALEIAMDELAEGLGMDPVALRMRNIPERNQKKDLPWSSNELRACYETGAERFGWERRPEPGVMRDGHERIGWGMATAIYHSERAPAQVSATLFANGSALLRSAASDMGPGTYTSMTQVAADALGLPVEQVRFELGDTEMPWAPVHGGSITMASVGNGVAAACAALEERLVALAGEEPDLAGEGEPICSEGGVGRAGGPVVPFTELLRRRGLSSLEATAKAAPGEESKQIAASAFGAVFVEVRVDPELGTVRVPRMVGAYDVGRVINPKTARSQCIGGMVGGLGMALMEEGEWDPRFGRVMNSNLAEYLVPVCADIGDLDVTFVPGDDRAFNPLGAKGLAEIAICGVAPAIANAVSHATGRRIRALPITPERLLA